MKHCFMSGLLDRGCNLEKHAHGGFLTCEYILIASLKDKNALS